MQTQNTSKLETGQSNQSKICHIVELLYSLPEHPGRSIFSSQAFNDQATDQKSKWIINIRMNQLQSLMIVRMTEQPGVKQMQKIQQQQKKQSFLSSQREKKEGQRSPRQAAGRQRMRSMCDTRYATNLWPQGCRWKLPRIPAGEFMP